MSCCVKEHLMESLVNNVYNDEQLYNLGMIPNKCINGKLSLLIHCIDNIDIFNDQQKENINIMINNYSNV